MAGPALPLISFYPDSDICPTFERVLYSSIRLLAGL